MEAIQSRMSDMDLQHQAILQDKEPILHIGWGIKDTNIENTVLGERMGEGSHFRLQTDYKNYC